MHTIKISGCELAPVWILPSLLPFLPPSPFLPLSFFTLSRIKWSVYLLLLKGLSWLECTQTKPLVTSWLKQMSRRQMRRVRFLLLLLTFISRYLFYSSPNKQPLRNWVLLGSILQGDFWFYFDFWQQHTKQGILILWSYEWTEDNLFFKPAITKHSISRSGRQVGESNFSKVLN